ncbi:MAG: hypothetical protein MK233_04115 [Candidatus Poseidoniales archaeon]|jgi:hypothetical protein|nr:hypothetical protein [Candidatus Poseidoniales archaeon]
MTAEMEQALAITGLFLLMAASTGMLFVLRRLISSTGARDTVFTDEDEYWA